MTKIGITGFSGRVGGIICEYLHAEGLYVVGLDMRSEGSVWRNSKSFSSRVTEIRNFFADESLVRMADALKDLEVVVHCSGYSGNTVFSNRSEMEYANVFLTGMLCDAMLTADQPIKLIHFSSSKVYCSGQTGVNESGKLVACDSKTYAGSKVSAEKLIEEKLGQSSVNYGLIRLAPLNIEVGRGKLNAIRRVYSTHFPLPIISQDSNINLSICSVATLQKFIPLLVEQPLPNGPINMCDNDAVSLRGLMLSSSPVSSIRLPIPRSLSLWLRSFFGAPATMDNRTLRMFAIDGN